MKVSNIELLRAIWRQQLLNLSSGVIVNYVGGYVGLCNSDTTNRHRASKVNAAQYSRFVGYLPADRRICKSHMNLRIKALLELGHLSNMDSRKGDNFFFMLDNVLAFEAWLFAREYWIGVGVPECGSTKIEDFESKLFDLQTALITKFKL